MAYNIIIRNLNATQFSVNSGITLQKGVYTVDVQGNNVGLKNKYTNKYLVDLTPFGLWRRWPDHTFAAVKDLSDYLENNIETAGTGPANELQATYEEVILSKLDIIIANQEINITKLNTIIANTAP